MDEVFEWKAEVAFKGTAEQFAKFADQMEAVAKQDYVSIQIPDWWPWPRPFPGFWPIDPWIFLGRDRVNKLIEGSPTMQIRYIRDIRGGIRRAHLHMGDQIVMLERDAFKEIVTQVAAGLVAQRVDAMGDYMDVMEGINELAATEM